MKSHTQIPNMLLQWKLDLFKNLPIFKTALCQLKYRFNKLRLFYETKITKIVNEIDYENEEPQNYAEAFLIEKKKRDDVSEMNHSFT